MLVLLFIFIHGTVRPKGGNISVFTKTGEHRYVKFNESKLREACVIKGDYIHSTLVTEAYKSMPVSENVMPGRKGFTLVELLVVIAIIGILAALTIGGANSAGCRASSSPSTFDAEVIRKYEVNQQIGENTGTVCRVDVKRQNSNFVETLIN